MFEETYTFDDLSLVPVHSTVRSRKEPDTKTIVGLKALKVPIISAPMNTVTGKHMAKTMSNLGAGAVVHRYMSIEEQCDILKEIVSCNVWFAVGASGDFLERAKELYNNGARFFCVDVANGHSEACINAVHNMRKAFAGFADCSIMAGNVCTAEGALNLEAAGADSIRCGLGTGAVCSTRLVTGFGIPQLSVIKWCSEAVKHASIIADGGIRTSGDAVKALAMGADAIMIGGLLAGASETPGKTQRDQNGRLYKVYKGMASVEAREDWFGRGVARFVPEGVSIEVQYKGEAKKIVEQLNDSIKVGMSFANARTLNQLRENARWVKVTDNGRREGNPNRRMFEK